MVGGCATSDLRGFFQFHLEKTGIKSKSGRDTLVTNHSTIITHHSPYHSVRCRNTPTNSTNNQIKFTLSCRILPSTYSHPQIEDRPLKRKTGYLKTKTGHLKLKTGQRNADTKQHTNPGTIRTLRDFRKINANTLMPCN